MTTTNSMMGPNRTATPLLPDIAGGARSSTRSMTDTSSSAGPATVVELSTTAKAATFGASGTKDFATVAKDARSALDAGYMKAGKTSSIYTTAAEWRELFSGLDRRSLYAIKSNEGERFTALEQDMAKTEMRDRLHADTGLDAVTSDGKSAPALKKAIGYLDNVSTEEKSSFDWALDRASIQSDYEARSRFEGQEPEKLDSTNPLVKMIKAAFDSLKELGDPSKHLEDMPLYKQAQQLFASQQTGASFTLDIKA